MNKKNFPEGPSQGENPNPARIYLTQGISQEVPLNKVRNIRTHQSTRTSCETMNMFIKIYFLKINT